MSGNDGIIKGFSEIRLNRILDFASVSRAMKSPFISHVAEKMNTFASAFSVNAFMDTEIRFVPAFHLLFVRLQFSTIHRS